MNPEKQTLQQQINRDDLRKKLHDKINMKNQQRYHVSLQQRKKIEKQVDKEKKLNDNDPRVTQLMKDYYVNALRAYPNQDIYDPHTILENAEEEKLKYYNVCIRLLKDNNNNSEIDTSDFYFVAIHWR